MAEESGPLVGANFTADMWRGIFGGVSGIVQDYDGTAYGLTLPPGTDIAQLGSPTQQSSLVVAGHGHRIPAGETVGVEIPPSTDATIGRTDLIVARYDPSIVYNPADPDAVGPVRLVRIPGTEGSPSAPSPLVGSTGVSDLSLWSVTRRSGQSLNQSSTVNLRRREGRIIEASDGEPLPVAPLGTYARRAGMIFVREMVGAAPTWRLASLTGTVGYLPGYGPYGTPYPATVTYRIDPAAGVVHWSGMIRRTGGAFDWPGNTVMDITSAMPAIARPAGGHPGIQPIATGSAPSYPIEFRVRDDGRIGVQFRTTGTTNIPTGWWASLEGISYIGSAA